MTDIITAVLEERLRVGETVDLTPNDNFAEAWSNPVVGTIVTVSQDAIYVKLNIERVERDASGVFTQLRARVVQVNIGKLDTQTGTRPSDPKTTEGNKE
ncbi:hypothetical protein LCGC14_1364370 [marine sediment metagenome]|uniref:Uncharacterized protein n=1 Tax=marine sediment metagenome TaxID=412755 RepID=A0A0F9K796_9ZZZZ